MTPIVVRAQVVEAEITLDGELLRWRARFVVDAQGRMGEIPVDSGGWWCAGTGMLPYHPGTSYHAILDPSPGDGWQVRCVYCHPSLLGAAAGIWEAKFRAVSPQADGGPVGDLVLSGAGACPFVHAVGTVFGLTLRAS